MNALPKIGRQFAQLQRDLKTAIKEINAQAARKVAQGNYVASQELVALAKAVQEFAVETKELNNRWKTISKRKKENSRVDITPVWEFYRLVARAITSLGGESNFEDIIDWITKNAMGALKPGDISDGPKGQPIWQQGVFKAKRPMIKEGFLHAGAVKWKLTKSGRNLAGQSS